MSKTTKSKALGKCTSETYKVSVPIELVEAVAHIGVNFGFGEYELEQKYIETARKLLTEHEKNL